jgi:cellulose synthase/poly-beta-1,6-N-acetylglucosamine synthase-like glycosyltransferase
MIANILILIALGYFLFTCVLIIAWLQIKVNTNNLERKPLHKITVIIPVRNEEENIKELLNDLRNQTYPIDLFEVLVVDDSSTDKTTSIVQDFIHENTLHWKLLSQTNFSVASPKKRAIQLAIAEATGNIIITTDGDCSVGKNWLKKIEQVFGNQETKLVSSSVTFWKEENLFQQLQTIEFGSLVASGACSMALGFPSMCNGANLAYRKEAFFEVGGFSGNDELASGDDEFLMHKIAEKYPNGVQFLKDKEVIVRTQAQTDWGKFYAQRKRWASKWSHYQIISPKILAIFVFLSNFSILVSTGLLLFQTITYKDFLLILSFKFSAEFIFLGLVCNFLGHTSKIILIPFTQIIYPFYVTFFGLLAQRKTQKYEWKGRRLK